MLRPDLKLNSTHLPYAAAWRLHITGRKAW